MSLMSVLISSNSHTFIILVLVWYTRWDIIRLNKIGYDEIGLDNIELYAIL